MVRTTTEIAKIVRAFVKTLEPDIRVERVILYGSYANGNPHEWSDIDLAVISKDFANLSRWKRQALIGRALKNNPVMIEALAYSAAEFTHAPRQTFLGEIKSKGKVVYARQKRYAGRSRRWKNSSACR